MHLVQNTMPKVDVGTSCRQKPTWFSGHKMMNSAIPLKKPRAAIPKL